MKYPKVCPSCNGGGVSIRFTYGGKYESTKCWRCQGKGKIMVEVKPAKICPHCKQTIPGT